MGASLAVSKWELMSGGQRAYSPSSHAPDTNLHTWSCGIFHFGAKGDLRRAIMAFDLASAPVVGSPLVGGEIITDAYLEGECTSIFGAGGHSAFVARITRDDWVETEGTWNVYKTGSNWTTPGGDYDTVTPPSVSFTTPTALGAYSIPGLLGFVTDAIAARSSRVHLIARLTSEVDDGLDRLFAMRIGPYSANPTTLLLCLQYTPVTVETPRPRQGIQVGRAPVLRPAYDHLADLRQSEVGRTLRTLEEAERMAERAVRT